MSCSKSGSSSDYHPFARSLISPCFRRDCHMLEQYVNLMLTHPTFGRNLDVWDKFLTSEKPAARIKVGNKRTSSNFSFISKFMDSGSGSHPSATLSSSSSGNAAASSAHHPGSPRLGASSSTTLTPSVIQHHRDCDEFFQNEKDWLQIYNIAVKETLESLNARINAKSSESHHIPFVPSCFGNTSIIIMSWNRCFFREHHLHDHDPPVHML